MPRRARAIVPGKPHHVTYCLMANHVHRIAVPEAEGSLGTALRAAHARYSQWVNAREGWTGHLWQGRHFSCQLVEAHPWAAMRYVEQNPVRAGLSEVAEAYEWSSAAAHCGLRADPPASGALPDGVGPGVWRTHLAEPVTEEAAECLRNRTRSGLPCGDEGFVARVSGPVGWPLIVRGRGRPPKAVQEQRDAGLRPFCLTTRWTPTMPRRARVPRQTPVALLGCLPGVPAGVRPGVGRRLRGVAGRPWSVTAGAEGGS